MKNYVSIGIDISYTRTGLALCRYDRRHGMSFELYNFKTSKEENLLKRTNDIKYFIRDTISSSNIMGGRGIFAIEATAYGGKVSALMNGLNVSILTYLYDKYDAFKMLLVSPSSLKKYIGVKTSKKAEIRKKFLEINSMARKFCHDEIDAFFLSRLGMVCLKIEADGEIDFKDDKAVGILLDHKTNKKGKPLGLMRRVDEFYFRERGVYI